MKKILCIAICFLLSSFTVAKAHVLESSAPIGAILHVVPDDDPYAGTNTDLIFEVNDTAGAFDPAQCYCTIQVLQDDTVVTSKRIDGYDLNAAAKTLYATVVFPEIGVYKVQLIGDPVTHDVFAEFMLEYEVRVVRQSPQASAPSKESEAVTPIVSIAIGLVAIAIGGYFAFRSRKK